MLGFEILIVGVVDQRPVNGIVSSRSEVGVDNTVGGAVIGHHAAEPLFVVIRSEGRASVVGVIGSSTDAVVAVALFLYGEYAIGSRVPDPVSVRRFGIAEETVAGAIDVALIFVAHRLEWLNLITTYAVVGIRTDLYEHTPRTQGGLCTPVATGGEELSCSDVEEEVLIAVHEGG